MALRAGVTDPLNGLALCAGAGGLELGVTIAHAYLGRAYRTVCYVEREAYAAAALVARMEDEALDRAPVWDDLKTFRGRAWRGAVDLLTAGYPCQPFSAAGKRLGTADPRHLWPHVRRIIVQVRPRRVFLENVGGHLSLGFDVVHRELSQFGYTVAARLQSAAETGARHERERLFVMADAGHSGAGHSGWWQDAAARNERNGLHSRRAETHGRVGERREILADALGGADERRRECGELAGASKRVESERRERQRRWDAADDRREDVANAECHARRSKQQSRCAPSRRPEFERGDEHLAHAGVRRHRGWTAAFAEPGDAGEPGEDLEHAARIGWREGWAGQLIGGQPALANQAIFPLQPPGPGERDAWAAIVAADPLIAPALSRDDGARLARRIAGLDPDVDLRAKGGLVQGIPAPLRTAAAQRLVRGMADGLAEGMDARADRLRLTGNGVHPLAAAAAYCALDAELELRARARRRA